MGGVAVLVFLAYAASARTAPPHAAEEVRAGLHRALTAPHPAHATPIPDSQVIVGHPRDGIVELSGIERKLPR